MSKDFFHNYAVRDYSRKQKPRILRTILRDILPALVLAALAIWIFGAPG